MIMFDTNYHIIITLWWTNIAIENGPVEIVDFPINSMVIFHRKMLVYQRVIRHFFDFWRRWSCCTIRPRASATCAQVAEFPSGRPCRGAKGGAEVPFQKIRHGVVKKKNMKVPWKRNYVLFIIKCPMNLIPTTISHGFFESAPSQHLPS